MCHGYQLRILEERYIQVQEQGKGLRKQREELTEVLNLFETIEENERQTTIDLRRELEGLQGENVKGLWSAIISGVADDHSQFSTGASGGERDPSNSSDTPRENHLTPRRARHPFTISKKVNLSAALAGRRGPLPKRAMTMRRPKYTGGSVLKKTVHKTRSYSRGPFAPLVKKKACTALKMKGGAWNISAPIAVEPLPTAGLFGLPQPALRPILPNFPSYDSSEGSWGT